MFGPDPAKVIEIGNIDQGSAKRLEGDIYVLCFYVGTPSAPVNAQVHGPWGEELAEAEWWLMQQAANYGKRLNFKNACYGLNGELTLPPEEIPDGPEVPDAFFFAETVYKKQGFKNGWDVSEFIRRNLTDCKQWISIILCNTMGRSFACPVDKKLVSFNDKLFYLENCVVYRYEPWAPFGKTSSASLAHEILHLFGASDLYAHNDEERAFEKECRCRYPDSIMLGSPAGLRNNDVDEITAWLVGWGMRPNRLPNYNNRVVGDDKSS